MKLTVKQAGIVIDAIEAASDLERGKNREAIAEFALKLRKQYNFTPIRWENIGWKKKGCKMPDLTRKAKHAAVKKAT